MFRQGAAFLCAPQAITVWFQECQRLLRSILHTHYTQRQPNGWDKFSGFILAAADYMARYSWDRKADRITPRFLNAPEDIPLKTAFQFVRITETEPTAAP